MAIPRFYAGPKPLSKGITSLPDEESRHAATSKRLLEGDKIKVFDGLSKEGDAVITKVTKKTVEVEILSVIDVCADGIKLTIASALPKGSRQDILIEKCTELGMSEYWPMITERSVVKPEKSKIEKWQRTAIEACKQSQRSTIPKFHDIQTFDQVLKRVNEFDLSLIADIDGGSEKVIGDHTKKILVMIGPEGGFSDNELDDAAKEGLVRVSFSDRLLRTETAAITVAAVILNT